MNFLADENIDKEIVDSLRLSGHSVEYIAELLPSVSDDYIIEKANKNSLILITSDKDFGELVFRKNMIHKGIILIRLHGYSVKEKCSVINEFIKTHEDKIGNAFTVITPQNIRIRSKYDNLS